MTEYTTKDPFLVQAAKRWVEEAGNRRIWVWDELTKELGMMVVSALEEIGTNNNTLDVAIYINCRGGFVDSAFAIIDQITAINATVVTVVHGVALSAGCLIAAAGDKRIAHPHSRFLFHGAGCGIAQQKSRDTMIDDTEHAHIDDMVCTYMSKATKKNKTFWKKFITNSEDKWFDAEEALEWGVIDAII